MKAYGLTGHINPQLEHVLEGVLAGQTSFSIEEGVNAHSSHDAEYKNAVLDKNDPALTP